MAPEPTTTAPKPAAPRTEHPAPATEPGYATLSGEAGQPPVPPTDAPATLGPATPVAKTTSDQTEPPPAQLIGAPATGTKPTLGTTTSIATTTPDQAEPPPAQPADTPTTGTKPTTPTPGPEAIAGTPEPEPPARPADTPTPPKQTPTRSRTATAAGGLAVVGALVLLRGLSLETSYEEKFNVDLPFALWYLIPVTCLALVGGVVLLFARGGFRGAAGFLAGVVVTSAWGIPLLITATVDANVNNTYPGVWTALVGLVLLFVAGGVAVVSAHRDGAVRTVWRRPDRVGGTALVVAVVGASWLYYWSLSVPSDRLFAFGVVPTLLAVVVPVWTTCLRPRPFALAVAIGWLAGGLFVGLSLWEAAVEMEVGWTGLLGFFAALLAAVTSAAVDPSDQPLTR